MQTTKGLAPQLKTKLEPIQKPIVDKIPKKSAKASPKKSKQVSPKKSSHEDSVESNESMPKRRTKSSQPFGAPAKGNKYNVDSNDGS